MPIYTNIPEFPCHHPQRHRMLRSSIGIGPRGSGLYLCKDVLVVEQSNRYTIPRSSLAMPHESSVYDPVLGDTILFRTDSGDVLRIGVIVSVEPNGGDITFEAYGEITTSGYSPTISVSEIEGGHRLTIHDVLSTRTVDIMDGVDGAVGEKGDPFEFDDFTQEQLDDLRQEVASVYCRKLESTYQTSGTTSRIPIPFNVSEFDMLLVDIEGLSLTENVDYHVDGNDIVLEVPITHDDTKVNTKLLSFVTLNVSDLADLASMVVSPTLDVSDIEGGHRITINDVAGTTVLDVMDGLPGPAGPAGPQGDQGEQGEKGDRGDPGAGMIAGGNAGQVFAKASDDDYDAEWTSDLDVDSIDVANDATVAGNGSIDGTLDVGGRLSLGDGSTTAEAAVYAKLASRNASAIRLIDCDANGSGIVIGNGGLTVVGGGEAANNLYNELINAGSTAGAEQLHLASDSNLFLYSNCQTIANRKSLSFSSDGNIYHDGSYYSRSEAIKSGTLPSSTSLSGNGFYLRDSANVWVTRLIPRFYNNGNEYLLIETHRNVSGIDKYAQLYMGLDASGNVVVSLGGTGAAKAWKDALGTCNTTPIFTGKSVSAGGTIGTYTSVFDYRLFWAQLASSNNDWCLCCRVGDTSTAGYIRGVGAYTTTSNSYVFEVNISVSTAGLCKVINAAQHVLNTTVGGTTLHVSALYGIK